MIVFKRFLKGLFIATCAFEAISCSEKAKNHEEYEQITKYRNGQIRERKIKINSDSIDFTCENFYPAGSIKSKYSMKNGQYNGYFKNFYPNGNVEFEGLFILGKKNGFFKYYDSTGKLQKIISFINYRDSVVDRPNEIVRFNTDGDTILDKSYFYNFYSVGDTIKNGLDKYRFKVVSRGKMFKYSYIVFCNFDEKFNKIGNEECDATLMEKDEIMLTAKAQKPGMNFVRGYILNTESPLTSNGALTGRAVEMYFSEKYYVVP